MDRSDAVAYAILGRYIREFRDKATQLNTYAIGGRWWKLNVSPDQAAAWADLGLLPEEAAPLIAAGRTPQQVRAEEDAAEMAVGGRDELAAQRIRDLAGPGMLIDPDVADRFGLDG